MPRTKQPAITRDEVSPDKAYSVSQVAPLLNFHPGHVKRLIREGRIKAFRPNGYEWRVSGEEVLKSIERSDYQGGLLPAKPSMIERGEYNIIEVPPEIAKRIIGL